MGSAPFLGGGFGHFFAYAPEKFEYPINRYAMEAKRQLDVLDRRLADSEYIAGPDYSIADIAIWPWYGQLALGRIYGDAGEFLSVDEYEHVQRWARQIDERPAVKRGRIVNKRPANRRAAARAPRRAAISSALLEPAELVAAVAARRTRAAKTRQPLLGDRVAEALHQPLVEPQIMLGHQHRAEDLARADQMVDIGALDRSSRPGTGSPARSAPGPRRSGRCGC